MTKIAVGATKVLTAATTPPDAHVASYLWSEGSDGTLLSLQPGDSDSATITGVATGTVRLTLATRNASGSPGPSYSEDVTVVDASPALPAPPEETPGAESVSIEWSDEPVDGAEVAPTPDEPVDQVAPPQWSTGAPPTTEESF